ncbi:MAG: hypothetical protein ACRC3B_20400, partial [Bacteroidia bacterium]
LSTITPSAAVTPGGTTIPAPPTIFTYGGVNANGFGQWAKAEYLSQNAASRGSANNATGAINEGENVTGWNVVRRRLRITPPFESNIARYESAVNAWLLTPHGFVRGHLMNGRLGGGAFPYNLTPITSEMNNSGVDSHYRLVERHIQRTISNRPTTANPTPTPNATNVFNYEVHAIYGNHPQRSRAPLQTMIQQTDLARRIQRGSLRVLTNTPADQTRRRTIENNLFNINRVYVYASYEIERLSYEERSLPLGFMTEFVQLTPNTATPPRWAPSGTPTRNEIRNNLPPFTVNAAVTATIQPLVP